MELAVNPVESKVTLGIGVSAIHLYARVTLGYTFEHLIADHEKLTKIETVATALDFFLESKNRLYELSATSLNNANTLGKFSLHFRS